jgi:hypothetical protein
LTDNGDLYGINPKYRPVGATRWVAQINNIIGHELTQYKQHEKGVNKCYKNEYPFYYPYCYPCPTGRLALPGAPDAPTCTTPIVVTSTLSSGVGTLRQAIADVCEDGRITFDGSLNGGTIDISAGSPITGELAIDKSLTISGTVPITVSGNNVTRVFNVMTATAAIDVNVTFNSLTIANGNVRTPRLRK